MIPHHLQVSKSNALHIVGSNVIYHKTLGLSTHLDPLFLQSCFLMYIVGWGWAPWRQPGILGLGYAACHQVHFTLSVCQSKRSENFPLKLCELSGVFLCPSLSLCHLFPDPYRLHTSPYSPPAAHSFPSWHPLEIRSPLSPKTYPLIPPYLCLKLCNPKIELREKGAELKELSFTFANQIRFKMVRRHEGVTLKPWDRHAGWFPTVRLVLSLLTLTVLMYFPFQKKKN